MGGKNRVTLATVASVRVFQLIRHLESANITSRRNNKPLRATDNRAMEAR